MDPLNQLASAIPEIRKTWKAEKLPNGDTVYTNTEGTLCFVEPVGTEEEVKAAKEKAQSTKIEGWSWYALPPAGMFVNLDAVKIIKK